MSRSTRPAGLAAIVAILVVGAFTWSPSALAAVTRHVSPGGQDVGDCVQNPCRTIGYAISQSNFGDTIAIAAGTYAEHVVVNRTLTLSGARAGSTVIDGSGTGTAVSIGSSTSRPTVRLLTVNISNVTIQNGLDTIGGGVLSIPFPGTNNAVTITGSVVSGNRANGSPAAGGGIYNAAGSTMSVSGTEVSGNLALGTAAGRTANGGGIYNAGTLTLTNSAVSNNEAEGAGGPPGGNGSGGGIYDTGTSTLSDSTVSANVAVGGGTLGVGPGAMGSGGGIWTAIGMTLARTTISDNRAFGGGHAPGPPGRGGAGMGGGISGSATLVNSTVSGNVSRGGLGYRAPGGAGSGGAIEATGSVNLVNSTVAGNQAIGGSPFPTSIGGGIRVVSATSLANSILAKNTALTGPDCSGTVSSGGHNLLGNDASCTGFTGPGDLMNVDPLLGPLQDNSGPTLTMALAPGSPAINTADDAVCAAPPVSNVDQRGFPRQYNPHCDMGAYEAQPARTGESQRERSQIRPARPLSAYAGGD